jgi:adenylate cyclase
MSTRVECTVLFADISGSTSIYARYGEEQARRVLAQCLALMSDICSRHSGNIVKTIGDEVMVRFDRPDDAVCAACEIHSTLTFGVVFEGIRLAARIGLHCGSAFSIKGDVYGDAPNVAARMTSIASAGQIITTYKTVERLKPETAASARCYDKITLKGGAHETSIYQVLWETDNTTRLITCADLDDKAAAACLQLRYKSHEIKARPNTPAVLLGRGSGCTLVVDADLVSRLHARIEYRRGRFVLIDQSTNGTFITPEAGQEVYLRREEMPLWGRGHISLGRGWRLGGVNLVYYSAE